jgi:hypothetical protein
VVRDPADPTGGAVTIRRDELVDDLSPVGGITQTIAWDEGESAQPWPSSAETMSHEYGSEERVHHPVVTVKDAAGNTASYRLAVAVRDTLAPRGTYVATPGAAFAGWTAVTVDETDAGDNLTAVADLERTIDWGDGTVQPWHPQLTHVYAEPGSYRPSVRLTDEAGNVSDWVATSTIAVTEDDLAPTTVLRVPARAASVSSWSTLRGRLDDGTGVGAKSVTVKVAQLRRGSWFGYRASTGSWTRTATKKAALRRAEGTTSPTATRRWAMQVKGVRPGTLVVRYRGADLMGNRTAWMTRQQRLTRR